jgi:hypothetical protein
MASDHNDLFQANGYLALPDGSDTTLHDVEGRILKTCPKASLSEYSIEFKANTLRGAAIKE